MRRLFISLVALVACVILFSLVFVNTKAFGDFLRREIGQQALQHWGAQVEVGSISIQWSRLALGLGNVSVFAADDPGHNRLAAARRLEVGLRFLPLLRGRIQLSDLLLDHPVVQIAIDDRGRSNWPAPAHGSASSRSPVSTAFNLRVGNCAITAGEVYYNNTRTPFELNLHNLQLETRHALLADEYDGTLSYDHGHLAGKSYTVGEHSVQLQFAATRSSFAVNRLVVTTLASQVTANANLTNYADPSIHGKYQGGVSLSELSRIIREPRLPSGVVLVNGEFAFSHRANAPFLASIEAQGTAFSERLSFRTAQKPIEVTAIRARYALQNDNLEVDDFSASVLAARALGNWSTKRLSARNSLTSLALSIQGISLRNASLSLAPPNLQRIPFQGSADLDVHASWPGTVRFATATAHLVIASPAQSHSQSPSATAIPVHGLLQASYDGRRNRLAFADSYLQTLDTRVSIRGTLKPQGGSDSQIAVVVTTGNLREIDELAELIRGALSPRVERPAGPPLSGSASLNAQINGTASAPRITGRLSARNFSVGSSHWRSLDTDISVNANQFSSANGSLTGLNHQEIRFSGSAGLQRWSLSAESPLSLEGFASNLSVTEIEQAANLDYPLGGQLAARVLVNGTPRNPNGQVRVTVTNGSAFGQPFEKLTVDAKAIGGNIHSILDLQTSAGAASIDFTYSLAAQSYDLQLKSDAIRLDQIASLQKRTPVSGTAQLSATGHGTLYDPQLQANLNVAQLQVADQNLSTLAAQLHIAGERVDFSVSSFVDQGSLRAQGSVELTGDRYATAQVDLKSLPIAAISASLSRSPGLAKLQGQTDLHATLHGPLKTPEEMQAQLEIPSFQVAYGNAQLRLVHPLIADYKHRILSVTPSQIQGTGTNLTFGGAFGISGGAVYALTADGSFDLGVLEQFAPEVRSSGQIEVHLQSRGSPSQPNLQGQFQLKNAYFSAASFPLGVEGINAQIRLNGTRADITNFAGVVGGGNVSARGSAYIGKQPRFDVAMSMSSVRLRYPQGLRSVLSGQLNLEGSPTNSTLSGRILINSMSFSQEFDLANFAGQFSENPPGTPPSAFESGMKLAVAVQSSQAIRLGSSKLSIAGSANLDLTGTLSNPVVLGRIALNSGEVFFLGKRFQVQNGAIAFANPVRTEPIVRLSVTTTIEQYSVRLNLNGPLDRLRTNYTSEPALPPADIIHLLAFGNTTAEAGSAPAPSASLGAESVLAQGVSGQVAGKVENLTGISQLTIDPLATNAQGDPGATIAIQQRVTGSLLFTFSTNVTETQNQTVELQYDVTKRVSVTVLRDQNGGYGIDLRIHRVF